MLLPSGTYSIPKIAPAEEYNRGSDSEINCIHHIDDTKPILISTDPNDNSSALSNKSDNVSLSSNIHKALDYGYLPLATAAESSAISGAPALTPTRMVDNPPLTGAKVDVRAPVGTRLQADRTTLEKCDVRQHKESEKLKAAAI